ncbi:hypothetical protein E4656_01020 [Natronospirillum operosum]|uniref:SAP domain-containing protein n=1 Tax=Natronospirillum operosum TaxID=2759953 RepID=A0A4Z0WDC5_9GAMM|nr:hypothetical protein E4656_01020 [Natronospirillum operosum]
MAERKGGVVNIIEVLKQSTDEGLDHLAKDKLDEVANVRLPRIIVEQEIAAALGSFSYVAGVLSASYPPTYAFLKLLMEEPDHAVSAAGFRERVLRRTDELTVWVESGAGLPGHKDYGLYRTMLAAAWEDEQRVNESEARMLEALREALGMSMREHLLIEHHPEIRRLWDGSKAYESARNYLLSRGIVLALDEQYILADEVRLQIRRYWGMELHDADYRVLLDQLTGAHLRGALEAHGLPLSGSKDERIERLVQGLISPSSVLEMLSLADLKDLARGLGMQVSLVKAELVSRIIAHFDHPPEHTDAEEEVVQEVEEEPPRKLGAEELYGLLSTFSGNLLYEMLAALGLPRSGTKADRISRLVESPYSEYTMFQQLRRKDLVAICRKMNLPIYGLKDEVIERLCAAPAPEEEEALEAAVVTDSVMPVAAEEDQPALQESGRDKAVSASAVPGFEYAFQNYPMLAEDQQVMLALTREARSLTERDVQRVAERHGLGWMLPKAHMAELLRKLAEVGPPPIRIRSAGSSNIYEWVDGAESSAERLDKWAARDIIDALRQGVVPERNLEMMYVGQEEARRHMREQFNYVATGRSAFKFIRGAYGSGKSFMMAWLRDAALDSGFAVATVRVSAEMSLANLADFYLGMMDGLRVPEKRSASGLSDILEAWLLTMQRRTEQVEGISSRNPQDRARLVTLVRERIQEQLSQLASLDAGLAPALGAFYEARMAGNEELAMQARAWLRGDRSLPNSALRQIGVRGSLEPEQVLPRLRALLEIIEVTHLRGLVILIDELELVRRRPHKGTRDQAYETLRALIDEVGENRLPRCLLVSTGTDTFFDDRRYGLASYEALYHRVCAPELTESFNSVRQPVIRLEGLNRERLIELATRARSIHARAYHWEAEQRLPDRDLQALVDKWTEFGGDCIDRLPRPFLRQLVHVLDICEENPQIQASECFADPEEDPEANEALMRLITE